MTIGIRIRAVTALSLITLLVFLPSAAEAG